jgi:hypothetical protein
LQVKNAARLGVTLHFGDQADVSFLEGVVDKVAAAGLSVFV